MKKRHRPILASEPAELRSFRFVTGAGSVELVAAEAGPEGQPAKLPRFKMNVYNGGPMSVGYYGRVIIDLAGLQIPDRAVPVHRDHDMGKIVGHGEARIEGGRVWIDGEISGTGEAAREVVGNGKNGFPWQASIEANPLRLEEIKAGASANVNGRPVSGPIMVMRRGELKGASFVSLGADGSTRVQVAASQKESAMDPKFVTWLLAKGFDKPEALSEAQVASLKASFDAEVPTPKTPEAPVAVVPPVQAADPAELLKAERVRVADIEAACVGEWSAEDGKKVAAIRASAIRSGSTVEQVNGELLKVLRASRPAAGVPAFIVGNSGASVDARLLVAALCMANRTTVGMDDKALVAEFGEQTVTAAHKLSRVRLTEVIEAAAAIDGVQLPRFGRGGNEWIRAAFSTLSLPGILSNVANKSLLSAYNAVPSAARQVCKIGQLADFKTHTRYRLTGNMTFEKIAGDGELKHGTVGEQSFTIKGDTYGKYFALTRQDIKNDDLGAFLEIPRMIGRGAAISIEELFFTLLLANANSFFGSGNANIYANAAAGLGDSALSVMVALMRNQTDPQGKPVNVSPSILVVPPALRDLADRLFVSRNVVVAGLASTSAASLTGGDNIHAGKYRPVDSPYLSNATFHANASAVDWYLFANPADLAAFELAFVDGVETPTIEEVGVAPDTLGMGFRGYHDVGVAALDPRAAVKADVG